MIGVDYDLIRRWLNVYQTAPGYIIASYLPHGRAPISQAFPVTDIDRAADWIARHAAAACTYVRVGTCETPPDGGRGEAEDTHALIGFWGDLDVQGPGHKGHGYAPTVEDAMNIMDGLPEPTVIFNSGGGLQPWWLFAEPWILDNPDEFEQAQSAAESWTKLLQDNGYYKVDSTSDLARILRPPGTLNHKRPYLKTYGSPLPVTVHEQTGRRYPRETLLSLIPEATLREQMAEGVTSPFAQPGDPNEDAQEIVNRWSEKTDWADLLKPSGWQLAHTSRKGTRYWTRPGKDVKDGYSAISDGKAEHTLTQFSDEANLPVSSRQVKLTKFRVFAELHHNGDGKAAYAAIAPEGSGKQKKKKDKANGTTEDVPTLASPADPLPNAEAFVADRWTHEHRPRLVCHGGVFHTWDGACWPEHEDAALKADLYAFLRDGIYRHVTAKGEVEERPFQPNRHKVADVLDALRATCHLSQTITPPAWLDDNGPVPADEIVAVANGLLHWPTRTLHPHTPRYFTHHAVPFAYDRDAPKPERWIAFLHELWGDDPDAIACLQEIIGYLISGDTSLQKMFLLVGPKRSGKGTIGRVVTGLLGPHHVTGPTLAGLATNFGLQALIGQPVALVSDARLRSGQDVLTERLLSISGEDTLTVDRKHRDPWTGRLPTRFVILSNELPRLADASGALASRFVVLTLTTSFYGREDPQLTDRLLTELPGILNWALDGLERLRVHGRFAPPQSSDDAIRELEDLGSPMGAFVRDRCVIGPDASAPVDELYQAWRDWCDEHGRDHPGTAQTFGRDLRAAVPGVRVTRPRGDGGRQRCYSGVRLRGPQEAPDRADSGVVHGPVRDAVRDEGAENPRSDGVVRGGPHSPHLIAREDSLDQDGNGQPTSTKARNGVDRGPPRTTDQPSPTELMIARLRREGRIPGDDVA